MDSPRLTSAFVLAASFWLGLLSAGKAASQTPTPVPTPVSGRSDLNQDQVVDEEDLFILMQDWGKVTGPVQSVIVHLEGLPDGARPLRLIRIPPGSFDMGSPANERARLPNEGPVRQVAISKDFFMGETEVTRAQWQTVMGVEIQGGYDFPIDSVSWRNLTEPDGFLDRLNSLGQGSFRLPTEAEWEYACRAGTSTRFFFGDNLSCDDDCGDCRLANQFMRWCDRLTPPNPVGGKTPNAFGLFDMHGNLSEWCADWYHPDYLGAPGDGSARLDQHPDYPHRVIRGGNWNSRARECRSASRNGTYPDYRYNRIGFRIVMTFD